MKVIKLFCWRRALLKRYYKFYNRFKFRFIGIELGRNSRIYNKVYIELCGITHVSIGHNFLCTSDNNFNPLSCNRKASFYITNGAKLTIKDGVGMSSPTIWCAKSITIGKNAHIGANCVIIDTDVHSIDFNHRIFGSEISSDVVPQSVTIEDDVWIGLNCIILKGVTIGAHSVIGAGSVVTKSIPADSLAAGNPCKIIRRL